MANENGSDVSEHPGGSEIADRNDPGNGNEPFAVDGIVDGDGSFANPRDPAASVEPAKRGRGRPRKHADAGTGGETRAESGEKQKRPSKLDLDLFASQLQGFHLMAAQLLKNPLLEITDKEAKQLASALKDIMAVHSINVSPSTLAYAKLIGAVGMIYGPRVAMMTAAKAAERKAKENATVFDQHGKPVM